jgi:TolB-like protein
MRIAIVEISCLALFLTASTALAQPFSARTGFGEAAGQSQETPPSARRSVTVERFANISDSAGDAWMGSGIAETLAADLIEDGMRVSLNPPPSVGASGNVLAGPGWIVRGGYQRLGDSLRITARIIEAASGASVHSVRIDGQADDFFALQDELSVNLRAGFPAALAPPATTALRPRPSIVTPPAVAMPPSDSSRVEAAQGGRGGLAITGALIDGPPAPVAPATITRNASGDATIRAVRLEAPLDMDGALDETVYTTVAPVDGFIQQLPDEGAPTTEQTEAWVFFDTQNIYISARLWDAAPESEWVANEMQRDSFQLINNENFSVSLDTFYDRRNGYAFQVNPIGGFFDFQITDEGNPNSDWNPIWDVRTGRFDGGWSVEMQIPFKSLRYRPGSAQMWGIQFSRRIYHKNESTYLTPVPISGGPGLFRISAAGTLTGIEVPAGNRTFEIKPYAIGSSATDLTADPQVRNDGDGDFGFDVKYGVTQNLTADFTYNTDFAQVEVDEQQVNLTRFSLFFPEKREFFLEGRGTFDFGRGASFGGGGAPGGGGRPGSGGFGGGDAPTIFFSRRIGLESGNTVPILGGGRLTGKVGDFSVGALNIQTDDIQANDVSDSGIRGTNFTVLRVKRDILRRSSIGGIFTSRSVSVEGDESNQAFGVDGAFSFYDNVNFNGYYARTQTPTPDGALDGNNDSYQTKFVYNGDLYAVGVDHLLVGENFNPEVGFLRRTDFRRTFAQGQFSPRPSMALVRQFKFGGSLDYIETVAGQVESRIVRGSFETEFENSDRFVADVQQSYEFLFDPFEITGDVTIPVGGYDFQDYFMSYAMGAQRRVAGTLSLQRGEFFGGTITTVGYTRGRVEITPQFSFEPSVSINRVELPQGDFTAKLVTTRMTYTFTPRMFFGGLLQYNSTRNTLSTNLRLRWEYQPGSELFVVYNDQRDTELTTPRGFPMLENRAFVVKLTRLFRF